MQLNKKNLGKLIGVLQTLYKKMNDKETINIDLKTYLNDWTPLDCLPERWCLKITESNKDRLEKWYIKHHGQIGLFKGHILSESYDGTYMHYNEDTEAIKSYFNCEEIDIEQFNKYVLNKI